MSEERKDRDLPRFGAGSTEGEQQPPRGNLASRARNRTVLLTPDAIGQVRASAAAEEAGGVQDPMNELLPPVSWDYQQPGSAAVAPEAPAPESYSSVGKGVEEVRREADSNATGRRTTGKFSSPVGPAAPRAPQPAPQMGQTMVMTSPAPGTGFGVRPGKGSTATNLRQAAPEPIPAPAPVMRAPAAPKSKIIGFLISFDANKNGEVFEIRAGRWLVTSRPTDHGDFILIDDETISPLHAIIRATGEGKMQVLDQLSEFGTGVTRVDSATEEEVAGTMANVSHGDTVRFGKRNFVVCVVPKGITATVQE